VAAAVSSEAKASSPHASPATRIPAELIPGLICVGVFLALAASGGGFAMTSWGPAGLFLLVLLLIVAFVGRSRLGRIPKASAAAIGFLGAFVAWNFLSIGWADVQGTALDGANKSLVYLIVFAIFTLLSWRLISAQIVMATYSLGLAVVGVVSIVQAIGAPDPSGALIFGRFADPTNYPNAVAALFIAGVWPAMSLAGARGVPWPARGLLLATAGVLAQMALLPQSRGFLIVLPLTVIVYLILSRNRLRAFIVLALVAAATALTAPTILDVFSTAESGGDVGGALADVRDAMIYSFGGLLAIGCLIGYVDVRWPVPERVATLAGRLLAGVAAVTAVVLAIVAVTAIGNPTDWATKRWDDFKGGYDSNGFADNRFSGELGNNRYDFWRVAIDDQIKPSPLIGEGSDNFANTYLVHRSSSEEPLYPHSLQLQILGGTGLVGGLLFGGFVVAAAMSLVGSWRRASSVATTGLIGVVATIATYFALHSSADWLWSFPAIVMPVLAWLGMAARLEPGESVERAMSTAPSRWLPTAGKVAVAAVALAVALFAAVALSLPWLAAREVQVASSSWQSDPERAFDRLDLARDLNPISAQPDLTAGAIASQLHDRNRVRAAFTRALDREPTNWYALLELGIVDGLEGDRRASLKELARARSLNPADPLIQEASRRVRRGDPMTLAEVDESLLRRVCTVVGRTDETRFCNFSDASSDVARYRLAYRR
jgi:hypothetical protein